MNGDTFKLRIIVMRMAWKKYLLRFCFVTSLLLIILLSAFGWLTYRQKQIVNRLVEVKKLILETNRQFPFTAPPDGLLREDRLAAWIQVSRDWLTASQRLQKEISIPAGAGVTNVFTFTNYSIIATHKLQALRKANMSEREYRWISDHLSRALNNMEFIGILDLNKHFVPGFDLSEDKLTPNQIARMQELARKHHGELKSVLTINEFDDGTWLYFDAEGTTTLRTEMQFP